MMANTTPQHKQKKSQKRKDRQQRRAERQKSKATAEKKNDAVKLRLGKKSLPGFLAKNVKTICQWLRDYSYLFMLADDYGLQKLDRMTPDKREKLVQNYVDVNDFIALVEEMLAANDAKNAELEKRSAADENADLDEIANMDDEPQPEPDFDSSDEPTEYGETYFEKTKEYVDSLVEIQ